MKPNNCKIDTLSILTVTVVVIGILSSFLDFGILSVFFSVTMPLIFCINCVFAVIGIFNKKYFYLIGIFIFLIFNPFFIQFSADREPKEHISILTFNVREFDQPISAKQKQNASTEIIKFVDSLKPDILIIQEASNTDWKKQKGYPYIFLSYRKGISKSFLTIYSIYPIVNKGYLDFPDTKNNAIFADIKIKQDTIRIYNAHLQSFAINKRILTENYDDFNYLKDFNNTISKQLQQAVQIKEHIDQSKKKVIICGDFNATPFSGTYRSLKKGLNDSYIKKGKGFGKTFSILKYPLRIDYVLTDKQIEVLSHDNFKINLSDHEPILVNFRIK